jgi:hypothetical protein
MTALQTKPRKLRVTHSLKVETATASKLGAILISKQQKGVT